jgi:hypothetical protein
MNKTESASLILKLYEMRREPLMRDARNWVVSFSPESTDDVMNAMINPKTSGMLRMVISYWDMAASFVNHGAIDQEMFEEVHGEHVIVFAKIEPYLNDIRVAFGNPTFLINLERLIMRQPDAKEMLASRREMIKRMMAARAEAAKTDSD